MKIQSVAILGAGVGGYEDSVHMIKAPEGKNDRIFDYTNDTEATCSK